MSDSTDPKPTELERALLDVGRDEKPSTESRDRAIAALGLTGITPGSGGGTPGASAPGGALASTKTVIAVLAAIAVGVIGWQIATTTKVPEPSAPVSAAPATEIPPAPAALPVASAAPAISPSASASSDVTAAPSASASASAARATASAPAAPAPSADTDTLAAELAKLDVARARLAAGNASGALTDLAAYDAAFPRGALRNEATVLRIEALVKAGRREEARKLGDLFLRTHATDVSGQRVRRLLDAP